MQKRVGRLEFGRSLWEGLMGYFTRLLDRLFCRCPNCHGFRELRLSADGVSDELFCPACEGERADDVPTYKRRL